MSEIDKAHEAIMNQKYEYLSKLTMIAFKLRNRNNYEDYQTLKKAIEFFDIYMKG